MSQKNQPKTWGNKYANAGLVLYGHQDGFQDIKNPEPRKHYARWTCLKGSENKEIFLQSVPESIRKEVETLINTSESLEKFNLR